MRNIVDSGSSVREPAPSGRSGARRPGLAADVALCLFLGFVFSASFFGRGVVSGDGLTAGNVVKVAFGVLAFGAVCFGAFRLLDSRRFAQFGGAFADRFFSMRARNVALLSGLILLCWIPTVALMYPFHIGPDTIAQLLWHEGYPVFDPSSREVLEGFSMSDHHPVFDTLLYGAFYDLGSDLGNPVWGMVALCWLQTAFAVVVFGYSCCWLREHGAPFVLCLLALAFWALDPCFPMLFEQVVKDITSMPLFILWTLCFIDVVLAARRRAPLSRGLFAALVVLTLLCALTRKTLLYITVPSLALVAVCLLVAAISARRRGEQACAGRRTLLVQVLSSCAVAVLVMMVLLPKVLFPAFGVAPGGVQETISVPIQQVSSVVAHHSSELSEEDMAAISAVLPVEEIPGLYTPGTADPVKDSWNRESSTSDAVRFLATWAKLALRYPADYVSSLAYLGNYVFVGSYCNDIPVVWWGWEGKGGAELFPDYPGGQRTEGQELLQSVVYEGVWGSNRATELLLDTAVYALWIPLFSLALILRRRPANALMFVPVLLSCAVLILVPAYQPRYSFNMLFLAPVIFSMPFFGGGDAGASRGRGLRIPRGVRGKRGAHAAS